MTNVNELFQSAQKAPGQIDGPEDMEAGTTLLCELKNVKGKTKDNGAIGFTVVVRVDDPESDNVGDVFFDGVHFSAGRNGEFSEGQLSYNKRCFAKLQAAGLDADFFGANPSVEAIAKALTGNKVMVTIGWQAPNEEGKVFGDHKWAPVAAGGGGGYVPGAVQSPPKGF